MLIDSVFNSIQNLAQIVAAIIDYMLQTVDIGQIRARKHEAHVMLN